MDAISYTARNFRHRARDIVNITNLAFLVIALGLDPGIDGRCVVHVRAGDEDLGREMSMFFAGARPLRRARRRRARCVRARTRDQAAGGGGWGGEFQNLARFGNRTQPRTSTF